MEKKKNSVNLTQKKPKNSEIKKEIESEENNKKIIVVALILALVLAIIAYWQISKKNDTSDKKEKNDSQTVEKSDIEKDDDDKNDSSNKNEKDESIGYNSEEVIKTNTQSYTEVDNKEAAENTNEEAESNEEDEEIFYSLTFETNGGDDIEKKVLSDTDLTESILPKKVGWSFAGWFTDTDLTEQFIFGRTLTEDTTLYAKWVKVVEFKTMNNELVDTKEIAENEEILMPTKEDVEDLIDNENEIGWFVQNIDDEENTTYSEITSGTKLDDTIPSDNEKITLYLKELKKFELQIFMKETDEDAFDTLEVVEERTIDLTEFENKLKEENIAEYALFYRDSDGIKYTFFKDQKASIDITKLYIDEAYTITFADYDFDDEDLENEDTISDETIDNNEVDNNTNNDANPIVIEEKDVAKDSHVKEELIPDIKKEGYDFIGWFEDLEDDSSKLTEEIIIDEDKLYIAKWKKKEEIIEDVVDENIVEPVDEEQITNTEEPIIVEETTEDKVSE